MIFIPIFLISNMALVAFLSCSDCLGNMHAEASITHFNARRLELPAATSKPPNVCLIAHCISRPEISTSPEHPTYAYVLLHLGVESHANMRLSVSETRDHTHGGLLFRCPVMSRCKRAANQHCYRSRRYTGDMVHLSTAARTTGVDLKLDNLSDNAARQWRLSVSSVRGWSSPQRWVLFTRLTRPKSWRQRPASLIVTQIRKKPCELVGSLARLFTANAI